MSYSLSSIFGSTQGVVQSTVCNGTVYTSLGRHVSVSNASTLSSRITSYGHVGVITNIAVSRCSKLLFVADVDSRGVITSTANHVVISRIKSRGRVQRSAFNANSDLLVTASDECVEIWDLKEKNTMFYCIVTPLVTRHSFLNSTISCMSWGGDGIIFGCSDHSSRVITISTKLSFEAVKHKSKLLAVSISFGATTTYSFSSDGTLIVAKKSTQSQEYLVDSCKNLSLDAPVECADFSGLAKVLCVGLTGGILKVFDVVSRDLIQSVCLKTYLLKPMRCTFDPVRAYILIDGDCSSDVCLWDYKLDTFLLKHSNELHDVTTIAMNSTYSLMATGTKFDTVNLWDVVSKTCMATFSQHNARVNQVLFLSNDRGLLSSSMDGTVRAYDILRYRNFRTFTAPNSRGISHIALDRSDEVLCGAAVDNFSIMLWSVLTGQLLDVLVGHTSPITSICVCRQTSHIVSSSWDGSTRVWDVYGKNRQIDSLFHSMEVQTAALSPCGTYLATMLINSTVSIWNIRTSNLHGSIVSNSTSYSSTSNSNRNRTNYTDCARLQFIHDSSLLASAESDMLVSIYDVQTCALVKRVFLPEGEPTLDSFVQLLCSVDGKNICVARSRQVFILKDSSDTIQRKDFDEQLSDKHLHFALQNSAFTEALIVATRLSNRRFFQAVLNALPPEHIKHIPYNLDSSTFKQFVSELCYCMKSSVHIHHILLMLREICRYRCDLISSNDLLHTLRAFVRELNALHGSIAVTTSKNQSALDFICTLTS